MTNWTKIERPLKGGRMKRTAPAVMKGSTGEAWLLIPDVSLDGKMATVYSDGNGKLAYRFTKDGDYVVKKYNKGAVMVKVVIPSPYTGRLPQGTHDVDLGKDGRMKVLDLNQVG